MIAEADESALVEQITGIFTRLFGLLERDHQRITDLENENRQTRHDLQQIRQELAHEVKCREALRHRMDREHVDLTEVWR